MDGYTSNFTKNIINLNFKVAAALLLVFLHNFKPALTPYHL